MDTDLEQKDAARPSIGPSTTTDSIRRQLEQAMRDGKVAEIGRGPTLGRVYCDRENRQMVWEGPLFGGTGVTPGHAPGIAADELVGRWESA